MWISLSLSLHYAKPHNLTIPHFLWRGSTCICSPLWAACTCSGSKKYTSVRCYFCISSFRRIRATHRLFGLSLPYHMLALPFSQQGSNPVNWKYMSGQNNAKGRFRSNVIRKPAWPKEKAKSDRIEVSSERSMAVHLIEASWTLQLQCNQRKCWEEQESTGIYNSNQFNRFGNLMDRHPLIHSYPELFFFGFWLVHVAIPAIHPSWRHQRPELTQISLPGLLMRWQRKWGRWPYRPKNRAWMQWLRAIAASYAIAVTRR